VNIFAVHPRTKFGFFTQFEVLMNRSYFVFAMLFPLLCFLCSTAHSQGQDGTIQSSWERAASVAPVERVTPSVPARQYRQPQTERSTPVSPWKQGRDSDSRPWPALSSTSTPRDYFDANTVVIDSLARLYCLSSNYIGTLRIRNEQAMQGFEPQVRDFNYQRDAAATGGQPTGHGRQSVRMLHKELLQLLDRCLVGR
jgi:hypothetical protein